MRGVPFEIFAGNAKPEPVEVVVFEAAWCGGACPGVEEAGGLGGVAVCEVAFFDD